MWQCNTTFDLEKIGHSDISHDPVICLLLFFVLKNILIFLTKRDSGELRCLATVPIVENSFYLANVKTCVFKVSQYNYDLLYKLEYNVIRRN